MTKKIIATISLILWFYTGNAQTYPPIHNSRPRIYIDSVRFAYLQNNIATGDCGATYNNFKTTVFNNWYNDPQLYLLGSDSTLWTWDFSSKWSKSQGQFVSALFKISGDSIALKRCRFLISRINNTIDTIHFDNYDWFTNEELIRNIADVGGMLLDWCYNDIPAVMRQRLSQNLYKIASYFMNTYILSAAGTEYVTGHNIWNVYYANQYAIILDSADDLSPLQRDTVKTWYQVSYDKAVNQILPAAGYYRDDDGGWNWTAAYSIWSLIDEFQFFENIRIATGKNIYTDYPWIKNSINQYWYFMQPDNYTINWGDGFTDMQGDRAVYLHARIYNDPRSLWLAQYWSAPANITWTWPLFQKLMYKDFTAPIISKPDIAHNWFSDKTGLSVSRSDWNDTATMVWFYNAPTKKAGHEHRDNNSFSIFKNSPQINNSGYYWSYGNPHYVNYYMRTVAHNSICVFDSTDTYTNWGVNVSNDGGQNESPALMNYSEIFSAAAKKGKWVLWGAGNDYCYNISDAEQSYDTTKLDRFTRRVLFYKPNQVIVLDHIHLKNTATKQRDARFILHFQNKPSISGNVINTKVTDHVETFNGQDILQKNGNGNVAIRTLLPASTSTTRIGGNGYEFYVNGVNYPLDVTPDTVHTTPGVWRIEVSPTTVSDSLIFLHTINIGDSNHVSVAGGVGQQNNFTIGVDWTNRLFLFNAKGDTNSVYQVMNAVTGNRSVNIFCADLIPSLPYNVLVDNNLVSTINADTVGVVETGIFLSAGIHKVEIKRKDSVVIIQPANNADSVLLYPNPVKNELNIIVSNNAYFDIRIISTDGKTILRTINSNKINVSELPAGLYFIQIQQGSKKYLTRFIKG